MRRIVAATGAALTALASLSAYATAAAASPDPGPLVPASSLAVKAPPGAVDQGVAPGATVASVEVVLAPSDRPALDSLLGRLYDPASPDYHHWLSPSQFAARFGPAGATVTQATAWLRERGLSPRRTSPFALTATAPTTELGRALGTTFHRYRSRTGESGLVARGVPLVPSGLRDAVTAINGLSTLPEIRPAYHPATPRRGTAPARPAATPSGVTSTSCSGAVSVATAYAGLTMAQLTSAYGVDALQNAGLTGGNQTVAVYEMAPYSSTDVTSYESCFHLSNPVSRVKVDSGGTPGSGGTFEADLDIEQVATQAPGAAIWSYEGPNSATGFYDTWSRIVNASPRANVISTSWGYCEADAWQGSGTSSAVQLLLAQAASQGQTVLAAAGDSGSQGCAEDLLSPSPPAYAGGLDVGYPAADQYVTAVGGTDYYGPAMETAWNDCYNLGTGCVSAQGYQSAGGGGASAQVTRPSWQPDVFDWSSARPCGTSCREVPDVSANAGIPMATFAGGAWAAGVGTSYSAPFLAGLVADRNQGCAAPTGNFTPALYGLAATAPGKQYGFSLPTVNPGGGLPAVGNNDMLNTGNGQFPVTPGYNLVTGLGTPLASGLACPDVLSVSPQNVAPGSTVTITGLGLENAQFYFGAAPATTSTESATQATVVVPAGANSVGVSAVAGGVAGSMTAVFTYPSSPSSTTSSTTTTSTTTTTTTLPPPSMTTTTSPTTSTTTTSTTTAPPPPPPVCATAPGRSLTGGAGVAAVDIGGCDGYFVVDSGGHVAAFGSASSHGDLGAYRLAAPIIAIEATPDGQGYWLLGSDGGVFTFGDARFYGSTGGLPLNAPIVGMAVTPDNKGYWMVAKDGGVFCFGDARFYGSTGNLRLAAPVDGIAVAPGGHGYWLVAADGGVFTFTPDGFYGSLGGIRLAKPIVGMSSTPDGRGYTLVGTDGGVFTFGDAPFYGSLGGHPPATPVVDLSPAPANDGYYLLTSGGAVYAFGPGTRYFGSV